MSPTAKKRQPVKTTEKQAGFTRGGKSRDEGARERAEGGRGWRDRRDRGACGDAAAQWRHLGQRLHALIKESAPELSPKTWYGMPAYAKANKVICFFRNADEVQGAVHTLGLQRQRDARRRLEMRPVAFALKALTAADEAPIRALVKKAVR